MHFKTFGSKIKHPSEQSPLLARLHECARMFVRFVANSGSRQTTFGTTLPCSLFLQPSIAQVPIGIGPTFGTLTNAGLFRPSPFPEDPIPSHPMLQLNRCESIS